MPNYDDWKLDTPEQYEIEDEDGTPIPHDPDEDDDMDSDLDTVPEPTPHDLGEPVGGDPMTDEEAAFWADENRDREEAEVARVSAGYDRAIRILSKGDWL